MTDGEWYAVLCTYGLISLWFSSLTVYALLFRAPEKATNRRSPVQLTMFALVVAACWPVMASVLVFDDMKQ